MTKEELIKENEMLKQELAKKSVGDYVGFAWKWSKREGFSVNIVKDIKADTRLLIDLEKQHEKGFYPVQIGTNNSKPRTKTKKSESKQAEEVITD